MITLHNAVLSPTHFKKYLTMLVFLYGSAVTPNLLSNGYHGLFPWG